ncbi:uncharacterized protein F4812DRAFT_462181 [Daldinia caldariorum]|uniref:uncharacterized protein n=1 Tax=Daldinia caldariorum TaxID=326644 RepID=UPI002008B927|nr:uncharacterized protein F4812DRAFT_462181 [Daldinia caldariorum]KAI1464857.1 hypothetical protein F4812DRAFT_462181 [Daldinia caldariorum]
MKSLRSRSSLGSSLASSSRVSTAATSMDLLGPEIVVGIDFGTTHSGVCWAINEGQKKIRLITDWTNPQAVNANAEKVPSVISYKNGQVSNWGYEVTMREDSFRWIKILLEPEHKYAKTIDDVKQSNALLTKLNKTADEVVSDYLRALWAYTKEDIRKRIDDENWENTFRLRVVLTVPAMWSHQAKDRTAKAARAAGLPVDISMVTEPEAAALATLRGKAEEDTLRPGDSFVVCDAGGGTVDLISYKVNSIHPLRVEECAIGDGDLCGSVFLDLAFVKYIAALIGEKQYAKIKEVSKKKMLKEFEFGIKRSFMGDDNKDYSVDLRGVEDNEEEGIVDDNVPLKANMLRTVFDHICGQIDTLVQNQTMEVQGRGLKVKAILLVGGFGESKYLHSRLENAYTSEGIRVLQVDGAWSAICRGACMWGLEQVRKPLSQTEKGLPPYSAIDNAGIPATPKMDSTIVSRISRYSYGVPVMENFDPKKHLWRDRILDPSTGQYAADNQMRWLLKRGEMMRENDILPIDIQQAVHGIGWTSTGAREFSQVLLYSDQQEPPTRRDESVKKLCELSFVIPESVIWSHTGSYKSPVEKGKWRDCIFNLMVILGSATLEFEVYYHGYRVAHTEAKYAQDT